MKQPKYKFGDIVKSTGGEPFKVASIKKRARCDLYVYDREEGDCATDEEFLEIYQEPQKKKLYAYKDNTGVIKFCTHENSFGARLGLLMTRVAEYDIEYPETK